MKIGIIADTHTKVKKAKRAIDALVADGAEFMLHAGDIVDVEVLHLLKESGLRYEAVYGNNDAHLAQFHNQFNLVQEPYYFKLANTKFKLMHLPFYMTPDVDVIIFAHTHEFSVEFVNNTLFLNSGEVCARNKPLSEWAMLEIKESEFIVTSYTRANKSDKIKKEEFRYTRQNHE
ncbi:MAG: YfcE family phosphodiesterase [Sulfurimonas sp.]|uniref:metallophosphoesterase family protein n=1 Tax=Sulfurimonas sp. TaxID=2022749 RepID=UPI0025F7EBC1|nr:YfcE family phosphodiesterase [Sulfurimonas sp.]MCK9454626.1 YfcE family phosphodiesterase [Sulfurimonas sp.]